MPFAAASCSPFHSGLMSIWQAAGFLNRTATFHSINKERKYEIAREFALREVCSSNGMVQYI